MLVSLYLTESYQNGSSQEKDNIIAYNNNAWDRIGYLIYQVKGHPFPHSGRNKI